MKTLRVKTERSDSAEIDKMAEKIKLHNRNVLKAGHQLGVNSGMSLVGQLQQAGNSKIVLQKIQSNPYKSGRVILNDSLHALCFLSNHSRLPNKHTLPNKRTPWKN